MDTKYITVFTVLLGIIATISISSAMTYPVVKLTAAVDLSGYANNTNPVFSTSVTTPWLYVTNISASSVEISDSLNVTGNFETPCITCDGNDTYFHGNGYFAGNVTAPNIEVMESLIVHGNSTCSGTVAACSDAMFVGNPTLCGWTVNTGQRGCWWRWWTGTCVGTATSCASMSTSTCSEQHNCVLVSEEGFTFGAGGFVGNITFIGNTTMVGNLNVTGEVNATIFNGAWNGSAAYALNTSLATMAWNQTNASYDTLLHSHTYFNDTLNLAVGTFVPVAGCSQTTSMYYYDDCTFNITEVGGGAGGIDFKVNFTGVANFNRIILREVYYGGSAHIVTVQLFDWTSNSWDNYLDIGTQSGLTQTDLYIADPSNHIIGGNVTFRFYHAPNGVATHKFIVDMVQLVDGGASLTNIEHDGLQGRNNPTNHPMMWNFLTNRTYIPWFQDINQTNSTYPAINATGWLNEFGYNGTWGQFKNVTSTFGRFEKFYLGYNSPSTTLAYVFQLTGNQAVPRFGMAFRDATATHPAYTSTWNADAVDVNTFGFIDTMATGTAKMGMQMTGLTGTDATITPYLAGGVSGSTAPSVPLIVFRAGKHNGATGVTSIAATEILAAFRNWATDVVYIYGNGRLAAPMVNATSISTNFINATAGKINQLNSTSISTNYINFSSTNYPINQTNETYPAINATGWLNQFGYNGTKGQFNNITGNSIGVTGTGTFHNGNIILGGESYEIDVFGSVTAQTYSYTAQLSLGGAAGYFGGATNSLYLADNTYAINAVGDAYIDGALTYTGGSDPPYVLYFNETKEHIVELTRRYVPTERASGMAQVYIPSDPRIKWFQPSTCTFFGEKADKDGYMVKSAIDIINDGKPCYNANTTTIYSWDSINGNVTSHQAVNYPRIPMPANTTVNKATGKLENKTSPIGVRA